MNNIDQPQHTKAEEQAYNQAKATPPDPRHGREPEPKSLAQYLDEYIREEIDSGCYYDGCWRELLKQAFDAYESTEGVKIRIERV